MSASIASIVLACASAQEAKAPDAALFDELIRKANELRAFVAVYKDHAPDSDGKLSIRITFRAPDEIKIEFPKQVLMCIRRGVMEVRAPASGGKSLTASIPMFEQSADRGRRFANLVRSEFPGATNDWPTEIECGPELQMKISPSGKGDEEDFQFMAAYFCPRTSVLGWLESWKSRTDVRIEDGEHLVFTTSKGSEFRLSTRTGFIESVRKRKSDGVYSFQLDSLDLDPELDAASFELPAPAAGAVDASEQFTGQCQNMITEGQRKKLLKWIADRVSGGKVEWDADTRTKLGKILEALHFEGFALENAPWIEHTRKWTEGYGHSLRERFAKADGPELEGEIGEQRETLLESLQKMLQQRLSTLAIDEGAVVDAELRSSLEKLESAAVQSAFDHAVQDPLLESFDDQMQREERRLIAHDRDRDTMGLKCMVDIVEAALESRRWEVIVQPDHEAHLPVVVTAYPLESS